MRGTELLERMDLADPAYVAEADRPRKRRAHPFRRWGALAACFCLVLGLAVPAMAASVPGFYDLLYAAAPATAQFFRPVQQSCEDNGIRMEVLAAYLHQDTAEIYLSLQDLEGQRLDETTDLFDSYQLLTPFDCTATCSLTHFDAGTQTATFLLRIQQWGQRDITGSKLTFSLDKFLSHKESWEGEIEGIDLRQAAENAAAQRVFLRGSSGSEAEDGDNAAVLQPMGTLASPTPGVTVTGMGYVDGCLHVQVRYEDILQTDDHGSLSLLDAASGETIPCEGSLAFFDADGTSSYEDYLFPGVSAEQLGQYVLSGEFVTSTGPVEGNWSVTFPLENSNG